MKDFFVKNPISYLILFCLLALVAGVESGNIIKNGMPEQEGVSYLVIFGIVINFILSFYFLNVYMKIRRKENSKQ